MPTKLVIPQPNIQRVGVKIVGTAPYVQKKMSRKALDQMEQAQAGGSTARSKKVREPKDFEQTWLDAQHISEEGWIGIPAAAFRNAMISGCRTVGFKMTVAKMSVFVIGDGLDATEGTPLIKIYGEPEIHKGYGLTTTGVPNVMWRPMWRKWHAFIRISFDADQFSAEDVLNLLMRAGMQVGVGEGRPDSKNSAGMGWGTFEIPAGEEVATW